MTVSAPETPDLGSAVVALLKGVVYRDTHERVWHDLLAQRSQVSDYVSVIGLQLLVDEAEGYAYLRSREAEEGDPEPPPLVARRSLSFHVRLLLALLR